MRAGLINLPVLAEQVGLGPYDPYNSSYFTTNIYTACDERSRTKTNKTVQNVSSITSRFLYFINCVTFSFSYIFHI
jgi:hypothetical protein